MKPYATKRVEQSGWYALTLKAHGCAPLTEEEEFPPLSKTWNNHAKSDAKLRSERPALPVYIPEQKGQEGRPQKERRSGKGHGDVGSTDSQLHLLATAFPMASAEIVEVGTFPEEVLHTRLLRICRHCSALFEWRLLLCGHHDTFFQKYNCGHVG